MSILLRCSRQCIIAHNHIRYFSGKAFKTVRTLSNILLIAKPYSASLNSRDAKCKTSRALWRDEQASELASLIFYEGHSLLNNQT